MKKLLEIQDLILRFYTYEGIVKALEGVNLDLAPDETLGVVGETGCGKTVTALSLLVLPPPPGKIEQGKILFHQSDGQTIDLLSQSEEELQGIRGKEIAMIFQEPGAALNPVYTIGDQISEVLFLHRRNELYHRALAELERQKEEFKGIFSPFLSLKNKLERGIFHRLVYEPQSALTRLLGKLPLIVERRLKKEAKKISIELLRDMEIPDPERIVDRYPHELSGGMKQRVVIAIAVACHPKLLIADEPTTSLDVTIQAQILNLIRRLKEELGSSILYITHNLGIVAETCDRVAVMYAGSICEVAGVRELFHNPCHPYTKALLETIPKPQSSLKFIPGMVPQLIDPPPGCRFHPRCPHAREICAQKPPSLKEISPGHWVACYLYL